MRPENARLARLRGNLEPVDVGARGIESVARNIECMRLRAIVIAGLTPTVVVKQILGGVPDAMSPFAMTLTQSFERRLMANAGGSILTAYREKGLLSQAEAKIASIADLAPGDDPLGSVDIRLCARGSLEGGKLIQSWKTEASLGSDPVERRAMAAGGAAAARQSR